MQEDENATRKSQLASPVLRKKVLFANNLACVGVVGVSVVLPEILGLSLQSATERSLLLLLACLIPCFLVLHGVFLLRLHSPSLHTSTGILRGISGLLWGSLFFHFLGVMFGAPLIEDAGRTFLWAVLMATLVALPAACFLGFDPRRLVLITVFDPSSSSSSIESSLSLPADGAIVGTWVGAFVIPLDWDREWQVWPVSCCYGAIGGYLLGSFLSALFMFVVPTPPTKED
ncbi:Glycosylphosphatidylinositol anchor biosynthesis protein 11 [Balamuthia mandrillaris]